MNKPLFVAISDIHFNLQTLPLASQALRAALKKAEDLNIPLVIAGDLHDSKAIIRAEVMNELMSILYHPKVKVILLVGNHDLINEKSSSHGLGYLSQFVDIISFPSYRWIGNEYIALIPYMSGPDFQTVLNNSIGQIPKRHILVCHQGFLGAHLGDYVQDKTSIDPESVKDFTVISGHYHRHQTIGTVTYIGSPFTMSYGEVNDGAKGFLVVNEDGSFTREILNFRKHVIVEVIVYPNGDLNFLDMPEINSHDLLWVKVKGSRMALKSINKEHIGNFLIGHSNFKLDLIADDIEHVQLKVDNLTSSQILDSIIDEHGQNIDQLKALWRELETFKC